MIVHSLVRNSYASVNSACARADGGWALVELSDALYLYI